MLALAIVECVYTRMNGTFKDEILRMPSIPANSEKAHRYPTLMNNLMAALPVQEPRHFDS
jgi:hypothetical protein